MSVLAEIFYWLLNMSIENILSYKKLTVLSSLAFGALLTAVAFVLITNAAGG